VRKRWAVLVSQENGGTRLGQPAAGESAAAAARRGRARFLPSFVSLKDEVTMACAGQECWEAQVVAAIQAVLEFAALDPEGAHALTVDARRRSSKEVDLEREAIDYFAALLRRVVTVEKRFAISNEEAIIESIATIVRGHLVLGTAATLPDLAPDLVYITLMPYLENAEARRWAAVSAGA
jgi:hypothetical protein